MLFEKFHAGLAHHDKAGVKSVLGDLGSFRKLFVGVRFLFVVEVQDRSLENVHYQLVTFALRVSWCHFNSSELAEPHQLPVIKFGMVEPFELRSDFLHNRWQSARSLLINRPVTIRQHLDARQIGAPDLVVSIFDEICVHIFRQLNIFEHLGHFVNGVDAELHLELREHQLLSFLGNHSLVKQSCGQVGLVSLDVDIAAMKAAE